MVDFDWIFCVTIPYICMPYYFELYKVRNRECPNCFMNNDFTDLQTDIERDLFRKPYNLGISEDINDAENTENLWM